MITIELFRLVTFCLGALMVLVGVVAATWVKPRNESAGCLQFAAIVIGAVVMVAAVPWL